jgi:hypothetical protein
MHAHDDRAADLGRRAGAVRPAPTSGPVGSGVGFDGLRLLQLQRLAGNSAVAGLVRARPGQPADNPPVVQRACGCGGDCCAEGEASTEESAPLAPVQREGEAAPPTPPQPAAGGVGGPGKPELPGSPAACVTSALVPSWRSGIIRTVDGTVGERFAVKAEWDSAPFRGESSYCAAECGEYRQYVRGRMLSSSYPDGRDPVDVSPVVADGGKIDPGTFKEDALDGDASRRYGHRDENQKGADRYDPEPRRSGPAYTGQDFPNISLGTWADIDLEFVGKTIDVCNGGKETSSNQWTVKYTGVIRPQAQRLPEPATGTGAPPAHRAMCAPGACDCPPPASAGSSDAAPDAGSMLGRLGPGRPLGDAQGRMEPVLGEDLADVRVHTDPTAAGLASELGAKAFTVGNDIGFGADEFRPGTPEGDALLAHELAHTVQQRGATAADRDVRTWSAEPAESAEERDADRTAAGAFARLWSSVRGGAQRIAGQAMPQLRSGLRLRRCSKPAGEKCCEGPTVLNPAALKPLEADHDCNPLPSARNDVFAVSKHTGGPFDHPTIYGQTGVGAQATAVDFINSANIDQAPKCADKCKPTLPGDKPPNLRISPFVYTQAGRYEERPRKGKGKCKGKMLPAFEVISPTLAERIKQAEIEHCRDAKEAWKLTYGTYIAGVLMLRDGFCPDPGQVNLDAGPKAACQVEYKKALEKLTGFSSAESVQASFACLVNQSEDRDTKKWHTLKFTYAEEKVAEDCSGVDLIVSDENQLPEVGKHPTSELMVPECIPKARP